jgi:hypothetical protein
MRGTNVFEAVSSLVSRTNKTAEGELVAMCNRIRKV